MFFFVGLDFESGVQYFFIVRVINFVGFYV